MAKQIGGRIPLHKLTKSSLKTPSAAEEERFRGLGSVVVHRLKGYRIPGLVPILDWVGQTPCNAASAWLAKVCHISSTV